MSRNNGSKPAGGFTYTNIKIPVNLHETMKALLEIRNKEGYGDLQLYSLYDEAVYQFVNAKAQKDLLKAYGHAEKPKGRGAGG